MSFISILLFLIGFYNFFYKRKYITLIIITILSTGYFRLTAPSFFLGPFSLQHGDLALLLIFLLLPFRVKTKNEMLNKIQMALLIFLFFLFISMFYDFFLRGTSLMQIFRTTRKTGYLMFFFLINTFNVASYTKLIKFLFFITIVHSIFFISQYIFGYSYTINTKNITAILRNEFGEVRYINGAPYIIPILVISLFYIKKLKTKTWLSIFFFVSIVLTQSRGAIISVISIFIFYFILEKKIKISTLFLIPFLFFGSYLFISSFLPIIGERFINLNNEIGSLVSVNLKNLDSLHYNGSFLFRFGLTYERLVYVLNDPVRILLGVGFVPDSDITRPLFILGTISPSLPTGFEQFNSVDIFFPNIITRYGIVGSIIYIYFIVQIFILSYSVRFLLWGKILLTYMFSMGIISLVNETFYNGQYLLIIFILIGLILIEKEEIDKQEIAE